MNEYFPRLSIFPIPQGLLDESATALKVLQKIGVLQIIDVDAEVLVLLPIVILREIVFQDGDDVRDACLTQGRPASKGEETKRSQSASSEVPR